MYPKPVDFRFTKDLFKFVGFLATIAFCGFGYTIAVMISRQADLKRIIIRSLDIVTVVVPPALPGLLQLLRLRSCTFSGDERRHHPCEYAIATFTNLLHFAFCDQHLRCYQYGMSLLSFG